MKKNHQQGIISYLQETLGIRPSLSAWKGVEKLPPAIRADYDFEETCLLDTRFLILRLHDEVELSPAATVKHLKWIEERHGLRGILCAGSIKSFNRKRLIEQKVPFIVPGNQLYLPDLGIDLREHLKRARQKPSKLSPSAQLVFLAFLLRQTLPERWTATALANLFRSSKMTMGRALEDLEGHSLIEFQTEWREKHVVLDGDRKSLWERALPLLRSPVQKRVFVENVDSSMGSLAGIAALSQTSMIMAPDRQIRAITSKEWKAVQKDAELRMIPKASADLAPLELEVWKYDPRQLSNSGMVDPLSLYLSLRDDPDERVQAALEEMLKEEGW